MLDGTHKPARGQGLLPGWCCLWGPCRPGRRCLATSFTTAEPQLCPTGGRGDPHRGCPSLPPPAWEGPTQSFTLPHTEGCLFFICRGIVASILVFLCFGVTQAKDGPFSRPHPGNLPFLSPCVPSGGAVLRVALCLCCCVRVSCPTPSGLHVSARRVGETGFAGVGKPPFSGLLALLRVSPPPTAPALGPSLPLLPTLC